MLIRDSLEGDALAGQAIAGHGATFAIDGARAGEAGFGQGQVLQHGCGQHIAGPGAGDAGRLGGMQEIDGAALERADERRGSIRPARNGRACLAKEHMGGEVGLGDGGAHIAVGVEQGFAERAEAEAVLFLADPVQAL